MNAKSLLVLVMLLGFGSVANAVSFPVGDEYIYQVKQGDNLTKLANELLIPEVSWDKVAHYNRLKSPHLITPGMNIYIRKAWLRSDPAQARIEALSGVVTLNGQAAKVGDSVGVGEELATLEGGHVRMSLPDGSTMNVLEQSEITVTQLDKKRQGDFFSAAFRLVTGRIEVFKKKFSLGGSPLSIRAKNATIGVRGTHFRVGQEGDNSLAEVEDGLVLFAPQHAGWPMLGREDGGEPKDLAGGQGSVADGINPPMVITLLPPPKFPTLPEFPPVLINFTMLDLPGAKAYRGEIAQDENFMHIIGSVNAKSNLISFSGLEAGRYWLRLRAVDEHGLQGVEAKVPFVVSAEVSAAVTKPSVILSPIALNPPNLEAGEQIKINWQGVTDQQYELQIADTENFRLPLITKLAQGTQLNVPSPKTGRYFMRVRATERERVGAWSNTVDLNVP